MKIAKLDDSMLSSVAGGHRRHCRPSLPGISLKLTDLVQTNVAVVIAPGAGGDITVNQGNTAVVA